MLSVGDKAPQFTLSDGEGNKIKLSDFKCRRLVLYFYPKNLTPGCTIYVQSSSPCFVNHSCPL